MKNCPVNVPPTPPNLLLLEIIILVFNTQKREKLFIVFVKLLDLLSFIKHGYIVCYFRVAIHKTNE